MAQVMKDINHQDPKDSKSEKMALETALPSESISKAISFPSDSLLEDDAPVDLDLRVSENEDDDFSLASPVPPTQDEGKMTNGQNEEDEGINSVGSPGSHIDSKLEENLLNGDFDDDKSSPSKEGEHEDISKNLEDKLLNEDDQVEDNEPSEVEQKKASDEEKICEEEEKICEEEEKICEEEEKKGSDEEKICENNISEVVKDNENEETNAESSAISETINNGDSGKENGEEEESGEAKTEEQKSDETKSNEQESVEAKVEEPESEKSVKKKEDKYDSDDEVPLVTRIKPKEGDKEKDDVLKQLERVTDGAVSITKINKKRKNSDSDSSDNKVSKTNDDGQNSDEDSESKIAATKQVDNGSDVGEVEKQDPLSEDTETKKPEEQENQEENEKVVENGEKEENGSAKDDSEGPEEDLLQIMEVRNSDEPELEINKMDSNENSCSSMDKEESMDVEMDKCDDNYEEAPMELEDLNIEKVMEGRDSMDSSNNRTLTNEDSDKENIEHKMEDVKDKTEGTKAQKRQLCDEESDSTENVKKIKLSEDEEALVQKEKYKTLKLTSLSEYMISKKLERITRAQLEELCLQKIAEAIASKSEVAELRHQLQTQEQIVDSCRKETSQIAKQCRDLQLVQVKLMQELKAKRSTEKAIIPVKITRSVGLQAYVGEDRRRPSLPPTTPTPTKPSTPNNTPTTTTNTTPAAASKPPIQRQNSNVNRTVNRPNGPNARPQPGPQPNRSSINNNSNSSNNNNNTQRTPQTPATKSPAPAKAVIDLTDEDDRTTKKVVQRSTVSTPTNNRSPAARQQNNNISRVTTQQNQSANRTGNAQKPGQTTQQGQRVMLLPVVNSKPVVLKVNSPGQNGLSNNQTISLIPQSARSVQRTNNQSVSVRSTPPSTVKVNKHPAPLPGPPASQYTKSSGKPVPPRPHLTISKTNDGNGILLQWKMPYNLLNYEGIASYQLYAYQETSKPPRTDDWGKIGDVKALALPMAVTLTQFASGNRYYFAVRAVDVQERMGLFSEPQTILL